MGRSPESTAREAVRARSKPKLAGRRSESEQGCLTGHPAFGQLVPAFELDVMPEGGGYPERFIEQVGKLMGVTDYHAVLHICSGSVRAPLALDWRPREGRLGCPDADVFSPMLAWEDRRAHLVECPARPTAPPATREQLLGGWRRPGAAVP